MPAGGGAELEAKVGRVWIHWICSFAFAMIVAVVVVEALLRFGVAPNISYERQRLYGPEMAAKKALFIGDSFMAHDHVGRKCFTGIVAAVENKGLALVNAAVPNTGPIDYLSQMKIQYGRRQFDSTYLFFYVGNDVTDTSGHNMYVWSTRTMLKSWARDAVLGSYLYNFYVQKRNEIAWSRAGGGNAVAVEIADERLAAAVRSGKMPVHHLSTALNNTRPELFLENLLLASEKSQAAWVRIEQLLDEMLEISRRKGTKLSIVVFPAAVQVDKSHFTFAELLGMQTDEATLVEAQPQRRLARYCTSRGLRCLDLLPDFRANRGIPLYLEYDDHLSPAGNELAAKRISEFLLSNEGLGGGAPHDLGDRDP